ncbi:MAG: M20/M25/M40 family metallo-hydrolase [Cyclobacteriaceae bacterium]
MKLLESLCSLHATAGNESAVKEFLIDFVKTESSHWKVKPEVIRGPELQDCLILKFGRPRTAVFAHMDSVGFTVRYQDQLIPIGQPVVKTGYTLVGSDNLGPIECELLLDDSDQQRYKFGRAIERGTDLVFKCNFREQGDFIQSCYLDNRLGIYNTLQIAKTLENGLLVFSCGEEHGGGSVPMLAKYTYENFQITQALISDVTWITDGIEHGKGVVLSLRDAGIPRRSFVNRILQLTEASGIDFQLEVEGSGSSDARELQASPYPIDWCFVGAAEDHVHSPDEKVHKDDIQSMVDLYTLLMENL